MDDSVSLPPRDRADSAKTSGIGSLSKGSQVVDSMSTSTEWTDEKHSLYLNSIEESFVNQLYSSEYYSKDLAGWFSRVQKLTNSPGSDTNNPPSGKFKVLRRGCWEKLKFEKAKSRAVIENESLRLSVNPWIQHFRSSSTAKEPHIISSDQVNDMDMVSQSIHFASQKHGKETSSSKQPLPFSSYVYRQDYVGSNAEVSDQNFVDMEHEGGEQLSKMCSKKRARTNVSLAKDQVVPSGKQFVRPTSNENGVFLKENNGECSSKNLEDPNHKNLEDPNLFAHLEPKLSLLKDQETNDPELKAG